MSTKIPIQAFTDRPGHVGADHQYINNTRQLPPTGRSMDGRCSTAKVDFGLLSNPKFPFVHEQTTPAALRTGNCVVDGLGRMAPPPLGDRIKMNGAYRYPALDARDRYARQARRHPLHSKLLHLQATPRRRVGMLSAAGQDSGTLFLLESTGTHHCISRSHRTAARARTPHCEPHAPRPPTPRHRQ